MKTIFGSRRQQTAALVVEFKLVEINNKTVVLWRVLGKSIEFFGINSEGKLSPHAHFFFGHEQRITRQGCATVLGRTAARPETQIAVGEAQFAVR